MPSTIVTDELRDWTEIRDQFRNMSYLGLLLGNGASQAFWQPFAYSSLYEVACSPTMRYPLTPTDRAFFADMDTVNFEAVLSALATTKMVCHHLGKESSDVEERYQSIRSSLIEAINRIHVSFDQVPTDQKRLLGDMLSCYRHIYTTNYDLMIYWAIMERKGYRNCNFKDFLWGVEQTFDSFNCEEWRKDATHVLYLHGALHLCQDAFGITKKRVFKEGSGTVLNQFDFNDEWIPLFVTEGTTKDKLRAIRRNDYLSFAYWKFTYHRGPLVVFGSALNKEYDQHIVDAMKHWRRYDLSRYDGDACPRRIAISIYPEIGSSEIIAMKNRLSEELHEHELYFFDSTTHPLGDGRLRIDVS